MSHELMADVEVELEDYVNNKLKTGLVLTHSETGRTSSSWVLKDSKGHAVEISVQEIEEKTAEPPEEWEDPPEEWEERDD